MQGIKALVNYFRRLTGWLSRLDVNGKIGWYNTKIILFCLAEQQPYLVLADMKIICPDKNTRNR